MKSSNNWNEYLKTEIPIVGKIISQHGYALEEDQPHIKGERFLMQALTTASGQKLILIGHDTDGRKVVIKATSDKNAKGELIHERTCRKLLHQIDFAYDIFHSPEELAFLSESNYLVSIQKFINQDRQFLDRPLEEQFDYALKSFKAQERARATTHKHVKQITNTFGNRTSGDYLYIYETFIILLKQNDIPNTTLDLVKTGFHRLKSNQERIEQYSGFLTHTDFVPHNFRIYDNKLYLLDFSSLRFGNKHESWARFLNFMTLYNPELENLLITYVEKNRAPEERESLQLMRIFRLGEIITYYTNTLKNSAGDLLKLNQTRVKFWSNVLEAELGNKRINRETVEAYKNNRDTLRSQDEKNRQLGLH